MGRIRRLESADQITISVSSYTIPGLLRPVGGFLTILRIGPTTQMVTHITRDSQNVWLAR